MSCRLSRQKARCYSEIIGRKRRKFAVDPVVSTPAGTDGKTKVYGGFDMLQTLTARLSIAAAILALGATTATGATRNFTVSAATIVDLYSATFDGGMLGCGATPTQECTFFGGNPPVGRAIAILQTGSGTGTMNVTYNDATGEITSVNSMILNLPTLKLTITPAPGSPTCGVGPCGSTIVDVIPGNAVPSVNDTPFAESGTGTLGRDLNGPNVALPLVGQGTADADQVPVTGNITAFHHNDAPNQDATDFSVFSEIVDQCVDNAPAGNCGLITLDLLTLDGVRYRLEGSVGCNPSGHALALKTQTANNSIYRVNFTATTSDVDCDGDTVANATDNCPDVSNVGQDDSGDGDGRGNVCDNCRNLANNTGAGAQADSDGDGFGNRCDGDLNQNSATNAQDYVLFRQQLGQPSVAPLYNRADINSNAVVNAQDYVQFRGLLGAAPGPGAGP